MLAWIRVSFQLSSLLLFFSSLILSLLSGLFFFVFVFITLS